MPMRHWLMKERFVAATRRRDYTQHYAERYGAMLLRLRCCFMKASASDKKSDVILWLAPLRCLSSSDNITRMIYSHIVGGRYDWHALMPATSYAIIVITTSSARTCHGDGAYDALINVWYHWWIWTITYTDGLRERRRYVKSEEIYCYRLLRCYGDDTSATALFVRYASEMACRARISLPAIGERRWI